VWGGVGGGEGWISGCEGMVGCEKDGKVRAELVG